MLPTEQFQTGLRITETGPGTPPSGEEIDTSETSFFVRSGENFDLEAVFVLDFSQSMADYRLPDGRNGIQAMIEAFDHALARIPTTHRVGVVELHDRNEAPRTLFPLTLDRSALLSTVQDFAAGAGTRFDPGSSEIRRAISVALGLFTSSAQRPYTTRVLVFLTDGRDRSSTVTWGSIISIAQGKGVQLYPLGIGTVLEGDYTQLLQAAQSTSGSYYSADRVDSLDRILQGLVQDLRGQYVVSYVTLRTSGTYTIQYDMRIGNVLSSPYRTAPINIANFKGDDRKGVVTFDPPSLDLTNHRAVMYMRALHIPRNISSIRFKLETQQALTLTIVPREDGGLLDGWQVAKEPDSSGYYTAAGLQPLAFGSFGPMFRVVVDGV
ncbi:MAG: VWA domain-containing protein, partial [Chloroflexi bacterium]|nr:VWA domain-containing protein [Chloroflexota bacterium]